MTLEADDSRAQYETNGTTGPWTVPFYFLANSHLQFVYTSSAGVDTTLTLDVDYSVTGAGNPAGGSITTTTAYAAGGLLTVIRNVPLTQLTEFVEGSAFPASANQDALDKLTMIAQQLYEVLSRAFVVPVGDTSDVVLPAATDRANKTLSFDSDGAPTVLAPVSGSAADVLTMLANTASGAEGAALVRYLWSLAYTTGSVGAWMKRTIFAADHGSTAAALQEALNRCRDLGGGRVIGDPAATYTGTMELVIPTNVLFDGQQCAINLTMGNGSVYGIRHRNNSGIINTRIAPIAAGVPSSQYIYWAPISIGAANGEGGTMASPSTYSSVHDVLIYGNTITPCRENGPAVQGAGDVFNIVVKGNILPSNALGSGIHFDWGDRGSPVSSADIAGTRAAFDLGNCMTLHPHDITIEDNRCGVLSVPAVGDLGSSIARLSACYRVTIRNNTADSTTLTGYRVIGGDLGFEFAAAAVKPYAMKGIVIDGMTINAPTASFKDGLYIDTLADNIYRAQIDNSYSPLIPARMHGDIRVTVDIAGPNVASGYGARITQAIGVHFVGGSFQKFELGIWWDEFTSDCSAFGVLTTANRLHGQRVGGPDLREDTERVSIMRCVSYGNGTAGTGYGLYQARGIDCSYQHNITGKKGEATQAFGIVIADNALTFGTRADFNTDLGAVTGGFSWPGSLAPYYFDQMASCQGNTADLSDPQAPIVVSQSYAVESSFMWGSRWAKNYVSIGTTSDPTTGHWKKGSKLRHFDLVAGGNPGKYVSTSGSLAGGALGGLTNASTTSGLKTVQMTLAARTMTVTNGAWPSGYYEGVVSSAANLRVGLVFSVAGSVTDATIIAISGTTIYSNKPMKGVVGAAFTTAGVIEGEVISINTTTPIAGAVVMNATGAGVVTLDTAASDTQSGRTVSYTAPVFKAEAAIAA